MIKGIIKKVELKDFKKRDGKSTFQKVIVDVQIINKENIVKLRKAQMNVDFAKRYFEYCGVKGKDLINKEVLVTLQTRAWTDNEGNSRSIEEIKCLALVDAEGNPIFLPKDKSEELPF